MAVERKSPSSIQPPSVFRTVASEAALCGPDHETPPTASRGSHKDLPTTFEGDPPTAKAEEGEGPGEESGLSGIGTVSAESAESPSLPRHADSERSGTMKLKKCEYHTVRLTPLYPYTAADWGGS